jgi:peptidoglycan/LPS O-acetylase OafA/YrhL
MKLQNPSMEPRPLRIAYAVEFLIALIAFFECWSQMGGQAPLDLMPWWVKLGMAVAFCAVVVRLTAVAVRNEAFPPLLLIRWSLALVMVLLVIALTTYYFYLREPVDEDSGDEPVTSSLTVDFSAYG